MGPVPSPARVPSPKAGALMTSYASTARTRTPNKTHKPQQNEKEGDFFTPVRGAAKARGGPNDGHTMRENGLSGLDSRVLPRRMG